MLITRNVLVEFIGRRESFYLPLAQPSTQNEIYLPIARLLFYSFFLVCCECLFNQTKRPHPVNKLVVLVVSLLLTLLTTDNNDDGPPTHSICLTKFSAFVFPFIIHSFASFVRVRDSVCTPRRLSLISSFSFLFLWYVLYFRWIFMWVANAPATDDTQTVDNAWNENEINFPFVSN